VTRVHANTGRIFIRLYVPGDHYRDRFRAEARAAATASSITPATVETYYTAQANGDGYYQSKGSDTPKTEGDVVRRTIYWKAGAFAAINASGFTEVVLDDDATYADLLAAIDDILNANGAPITIWSKRQEVTPSAALLDGYTDDLVGAFAPALLVPGYSGPCMRIRRSGDNAETDIGFDGIDLDRDAIADFCSPGDGFVKTWYDQSGEGNDATRATTSMQPKIYDAATGVELENSLPALNYTGVEILQSATLSLLAQPTTRISIATTASPLSNVGEGFQDGSVSNRQQLGYETNGNWRLFAGSIVNGPTGPSAGTTYLMHALFDGANTSLHVNSNFVYSANAGSQGLDQISLGGGLTSSFGRVSGKMQAAIIYSADKSADRTAIETALNGYFNIY
jgi:hypothetical protein